MRQITKQEPEATPVKVSLWQTIEILFRRFYISLFFAAVVGTIFFFANPLAGICTAFLAFCWSWITDAEG